GADQQQLRSQDQRPQQSDPAAFQRRQIAGQPTQNRPWHAAGFNETETDAGAFLSLKYSDTIYYNLDIKQAYITPFQSMVNYPSQNKFKVFSNWIKYLSEKQRLVLDSELELLDIGLNESIYYASYGMIGSELRYEQKVTDSMYVRTGLGGKLKEYLRYPVNNIRDFYGLIGLTAVF
ncbi:MAG TPA: hypothetical protein PKK26_17210, partial [Candidatus Wallbacteria bacterium]|nr:hypothetical protein [Candidatus Wallbacteria bacterium]